MNICTRNFDFITGALIRVCTGPVAAAIHFTVYIFNFPIFFFRGGGSLKISVAERGGYSNTSWLAGGLLKILGLRKQFLKPPLTFQPRNRDKIDDYLLGITW